MKTALLVYHSNATQLYPKEWIDEFKFSIENQDYADFDVIELNYGDDDLRIFNNSKYHKIFLPNHIYAMNNLIEHTLLNGYKIIANTNIDDIYSLDRLRLQINKIKEGYDLVSSNFVYFGERENVMTMSKYYIKDELNKDHNVICHPIVVTHKDFWNDGLRYNNILGSEDLDLWKRAIAIGRKFYILDEYLLQYRIHSNQITKTWQK